MRARREYGHEGRSETLNPKHKSALVLEIIQGKTTVWEASRQFDLLPSEIDDWVEQAGYGMENALRAR